MKIRSETINSFIKLIAKKIIMHAIMAKCFSILGYGIGKTMSKERMMNSKKDRMAGADRRIAHPITMADAGVVKPRK